MHRVTVLLATTLAGVLISGCLSELQPTAAVEVSVEGSRASAEGLDAARFIDGWAIEFERAMVSVANVGIQVGGILGGSGLTAIDAEVIDVMAQPSVVIRTIEVPLDTPSADAWLHFTVEPPGFEAGAQGTDSETVRQLADLGYSMWFEGVAEREGEFIRFETGFPLRRGFEECSLEPSGEGGASATVVAGETAQATIVMRPGELFRDRSLPAEVVDEDGNPPELRFQAWADAAGDDGIVDEIDLRSVRLDDVDGYGDFGLSASSLYDYARSSIGSGAVGLGQRGTCFETSGPSVR